LALFLRSCDQPLRLLDRWPLVELTGEQALK